MQFIVCQLHLNKEGFFKCTQGGGGETGRREGRVKTAEHSGISSHACPSLPQGRPATLTAAAPSTEPQALL